MHLLKKALTRFPLSMTEIYMFSALTSWERSLVRELIKWASKSVLGPTEPGFDPIMRTLGLDWPSQAETMIGLARLTNLEHCVTHVLLQGVPGDLAETGVWRGGASILMAGALRAHSDRERRVWLADSFQGLPKPDVDSYPEDRNDDLWTYPELAIPLEVVRRNFDRYGLLNEQVRFLPGWFRDTLPEAPIEKLAVLRLDGDMYESTTIALRSLYSKVSPGGFVIVDDYGSVPACRKAVEDFRSEMGVADPIGWIDFTGIVWQVSGRLLAGASAR